MSELKKPEKFIIPINPFVELPFERGYNEGLSVSEAYFTSILERLEAEVERLHTVLECSEDVEILKSENAHLLDENAKLQEAYDMAQSAAIARRLSKV